MGKYIVYLLGSDPGKPFQELADGRPGFEIFEQGPDRNSRTFKYPITTQFGG